MPKFRKKPVEIEAWQYWFENLDSAPEWVQKAHDGTDSFRKLVIPTLEGIMCARKGDWVIKGVNGEVYPCRSDIFEKTYEPVE